VTEVTIWGLDEQFEGVTVPNVECKVLGEPEHRCERELGAANWDAVERCRRGPSVAPAPPTRSTNPRACE
jgi:hypothetical protein